MKSSPKKSMGSNTDKSSQASVISDNSIEKNNNNFLLVFGWRDLAWLVIVMAVAVGSRMSEPSSLSTYAPDKSAQDNNSSHSYSRHLIEENESGYTPDRLCTMTEESSANTMVSHLGGTGTHRIRHISPYCLKLPLFDVHTFPVFTKRTCQKLIQAAEQINTWGEYSAFGESQATRDVSLDLLGKMLDAETIAELELVIGRVLGKYITDHFLDQQPDLDGKFNHLVSDEEQYDYDTVVQLKGTPFIIRYDANDVSNVRLHKDNAEVSFVILLSDPNDFEGGGTVFEAVGTDEPIFLEQGEALVFNGQLVHGAKSVTRGRRYVLSGFTRFSQDFMDMKRRSTMASTVMIE
jgi:hypothetical protein